MHMSECGTCPYCGEALRPDNLYLRGIAGALLRSEREDVGILSRSGLEQKQLERMQAAGIPAGLARSPRSRL